MTSADIKNLGYTSSSTSISLKGLNISCIDSTAFTAFPNLTDLDLSDNLIQTLDPITFSSLQKLKNLNVSNNNISSIDKNLLSNLTNLEIIWLINNPVTNNTLLLDDLSNSFPKIKIVRVLSGIHFKLFNQEINLYLD